MGKINVQIGFFWQVLRLLHVSGVLACCLPMKVGIVASEPSERKFPIGLEIYIYFLLLEEKIKVVFAYTKDVFYMFLPANQ